MHVQQHLHRPCAAQEAGLPASGKADELRTRLLEAEAAPATAGGGEGGFEFEEADELDLGELGLGDLLDVPPPALDTDAEADLFFDAGAGWDGPDDLDAVLGELEGMGRVGLDAPEGGGGGGDPAMMKWAEGLDSLPDSGGGGGGGGGSSWVDELFASAEREAAGGGRGGRGGGGGGGRGGGEGRYTGTGGYRRGSADLDSTWYDGAPAGLSAEDGAPASICEHPPNTH